MTASSDILFLFISVYKEKKNSEVQRRPDDDMDYLNQNMRKNVAVEMKAVSAAAERKPGSEFVTSLDSVAVLDVHRRS